MTEFLQTRIGTHRYKSPRADHRQEFKVTQRLVEHFRMIVTERYRTQYALLYTTRLTEAVTSKEVELSERTAYHNPAVSMSTEDMYRRR